MAASPVTGTETMGAEEDWPAMAMALRDNLAHAIDRLLQAEGI